jgi:hypothetical protein
MVTSVAVLEANPADFLLVVRIPDLIKNWGAEDVQRWVSWLHGGLQDEVSENRFN